MVTYNYKVLFPYGMENYFINDIIIDKLTNGTVYIEINYNILELINNLYKFNFNKIHKMDIRSRDIFNELKKLSELLYNLNDDYINDDKIKSSIITLIIKFIDKFGRNNFLNIFDNLQQKVIELFYKFIDKNKTLSELSEFIKIK